MPSRENQLSPEVLQRLKIQALEGRNSHLANVFQDLQGATTTSPTPAKKAALFRTYREWHDARRALNQGNLSPDRQIELKANAHQLEEAARRFAYAVLPEMVTKALEAADQAAASPDYDGIIIDPSEVIQSTAADALTRFTRRTPRPTDDKRPRWPNTTLSRASKLAVYGIADEHRRPEIPVGLNPSPRQITTCPPHRPPEEKLLKKEKIDDIQRFVAALPPDKRDIATLRLGLDDPDLPGLTFREVAEELRIPPSRAHRKFTAVQRGLKKMLYPPEQR